MSVTKDVARGEVEGLFELMRLRKLATRALGPLGFTLYEAMVLLYVDEGREHPQALVQALDVQPTAVSGLVTKLAQAGLVTRSSGERDGRKVHVRLTPVGRDAVRDINAAWAEQGAEPPHCARP